MEQDVATTTSAPSSSKLLLFYQYPQNDKNLVVLTGMNDTTFVILVRVPTIWCMFLDDKVLKKKPYSAFGGL